MGEGNSTTVGACRRRGRAHTRHAVLLATSSALAILTVAPVAQAAGPITIPPNLQNITIAPGSTATAIVVGNAGTVGVPVTKTAIVVQFGATLPSGITNAGLVAASAGAGTKVQAIVNQGVLAGGITNHGTIAASLSGSGNGPAYVRAIYNRLGFATSSGGITNSGLVTASGSSVNGFALATAVSATGSFSGNIVNTATGIIQAVATGPNGGGAEGVVIDVIGGNGFTNFGTITASASTARGLSIEALTGGITNAGFIAGGLDISIFNSVGGSVTNTGTLSASATGGIVVESGSLSGNITNAGVIQVNSSVKTGGGIAVAASGFVGGITNSGTITASSGFSAGGIVVTNAAFDTTNGGTVMGPIVNTGLIQMPGGAGLVVAGGSTILGGVTNTGTISGGGGAIVLTGEGGPTTILQSGGALIGNIVGNGTNAGDVLQVTGGKITLAAGQSVSGLGTYQQTGGTLALGVNPNTSAASALSAGMVTLGGAFLADPSGSIGALLQPGQFNDVIVSGTPIVGQFASVSTTAPLLTAALTPDAATANALDLVLAPNPAVLAALGGLVSNGGSGLTNTGTIHASAATVVGLIAAGTFTGSIVNAGLIDLTGSGTRFGVTGMFAGGSVGGAVINSGTINGVSAGRTVGINIAGTVAQGVTNTGVVNLTGATFATGILATAGAAPGNVSNAGTITASSSGTTLGGAFGIVIASSTFVGSAANSGLISVTSGHSSTGILIRVGSASGSVSNGGTITAVSSNANSGGAFGVFVNSGIFNGGVTNTGTVSVSAASFASGISVSSGTFSGRISNAGLVTATSSGGATGIFAAALTFSGGILNSGTVSVSAKNEPAGIGVNGITFLGGVTNRGMIAVTGTSDGAIGISVQAVSFSGGILNSGAMLASGPGAAAIEIGDVNDTTLKVFPVTFAGSISNSGTIIAVGGGGTGAAVRIFSPIAGGIRNTGTLIGSTAAIDLSLETGGATTITQAGGLMMGSILGPGIANGDVLNVSGGNLVLAPSNKIAGIGTVSQSGGTLTLQVTSNAMPGNFPTVSAGTIGLAGTLLASLQGSLVPFANMSSIVFKDVIVSGAPITGTETVATSLPILFSASLVPDAVTANADDLVVSFAPQNQSPTAQVLAQSLRFGMVGQDAVIDTIENRLQVGESGGGPALAFASARGDRLALSDADQQAQVPVSGSGMGLSLWGRLYGGVGSAPATGALPGFRDDRIGGIVGADWRFSPFVVGGGFHYVHTEAPFDDGSKTKLDTYQGLIYGGWRDGPAYVTALASGGANDYSINRNMVPFGLAGFATSSPSGTLFTAFGEAGYAFDWQGATLTPYLNLDYLHQHVGAFAETGSFGALAVSAANGNSLQATLGIRASTTIDLGSSGTLVPEVRAGWAHEFLDASQTLTAQLAGTAVSPFTVVGTSFGRDSAVVGLGVSHEFAPGASVFVDYDGKFTGSFDQHAGSVGVRVRF